MAPATPARVNILDGTIARFARAEGATIQMQALFRGYTFERDRVIVEYADLAAGERRRVRARSLFLAQGATAKLEATALADERWSAGLMTTLQHRVYLDRPARPCSCVIKPLSSTTIPLKDGRTIIAWMFPKRDHLAIGLGLCGKLEGRLLRAELATFVERVRTRLYPDAVVTAVKEEGHLLFGGWPRARTAQRGVMLGGSAAGLVDATNGEGIFEAAISGRFAAEATYGRRDVRGDRRPVCVARQRAIQTPPRASRASDAVPGRKAAPLWRAARAARCATRGFRMRLQREYHERSAMDKLSVLYTSALQFGLRASFA